MSEENKTVILTIIVILVFFFLGIRTIISFKYAYEMDHICFEIANRSLLVNEPKQWTKGERLCYEWLNYDTQKYIDEKWKGVK